MDQVDRERPRLMAAALRMLGSFADAEDAVQEAFERWARLSDEERAAIREPGAWLMRATGRICLDMLGSARARRERYVGPWLPEPVPADALTWPVTASSAPVDPADRVEHDDRVSTALLLVLETLTPAERVTFVLHDVFALSFREIADIVGRTPASCRQLAVSARRHVGSRRGASVSRERHAALVAAFAEATRSGRVAALVAVLDPDVELRSDGGGAVSAALRPIHGADRVARFLLGLARKQGEAEYEPVVTGDGDGILIRLDGRVAAVVTLATDGERITDVWMMRNPAKLGLWR